MTCPENSETAAVNVDALHALVSSDLRLKSCSRWPERSDCDQRCLAQIEQSPASCLVSSIVNAWYAGKSCVLCGHPIGAIVWHERPPALLSPERKAFEWSEIAPEKLPSVFATWQPLCWNCYLAETFRSEFPALPVDREHPPEPPRPPLNTTNVY